MVDFQNANGIFDVYGVYPNEKGNQRLLLGRFMIEDGKLRVLEDHNGMLKMLSNGPVGHSLQQLDSLARSPYTQVVSESEVKEGHHIGLIPQGKENPDPSGPQPGSPPDVVEQPASAEAPQIVDPNSPRFSMQTPPAVFDYMRVGMKEPQILEVHGQEVFMNGTKLSTRETERIMYTLETGLGKLRYRKKV
jgi:hypothetical protein